MPEIHPIFTHEIRQIGTKVVSRELIMYTISGHEVLPFHTGYGYMLEHCNTKNKTAFQTLLCTTDPFHLEQYGNTYYKVHQ